MAWRQARFSESISAVEALGSKVEDKEILVRKLEKRFSFVPHRFFFLISNNVLLVFLVDRRIRHPLFLFCQHRGCSTGVKPPFPEHYCIGSMPPGACFEWLWSGWYFPIFLFLSDEGSSQLFAFPKCCATAAYVRLDVAWCDILPIVSTF